MGRPYRGKKMKANSVSDLAVYTVHAMVAGRLSIDEIKEAARRTLRGRTPNEPQDIDTVANDIGLRGFHVGRDGCAWGVADERNNPAKAFVLVRLGFPFSDERS